MPKTQLFKIIMHYSAFVGNQLLKRRFASVRSLGFYAEMRDAGLLEAVQNVRHTWNPTGRVNCDQSLSMTLDSIQRKRGTVVRDCMTEGTGDGAGKRSKKGLGTRDGLHGPPLIFLRGYRCTFVLNTLFTLLRKSNIHRYRVRGRRFASCQGQNVYY